MRKLPGANAAGNAPARVRMLATLRGGRYIPAVPTTAPPHPGWDAAACALVELLPTTARGPRREGIFALWLTVRVTQDLLLDPPVPERARRRRLLALEHRLSSLTVPPPLRRALASAIAQLRDADAAAAPVVLSQLVAPARDGAGPEAADALAHAARAARARVAR